MAVRRTTPGKVISLTFKIIFVALIVFVNGLLIWRMISSGVPPAMKGFTANAKAAEAYQTYLLQLQDYNEKGNAGGGEKPMYAYNQAQAEITRSKEAYGYFSVHQVIIIPEAKQIQLVYRYNKSTLKHLKEDYELENVPDASEEPFEASLLLTTLNSDSQTRIYPTSTTRKNTTLYCYYRLVFDNVDITASTEGVFLDIYYKEDLNYSHSAYGTLCLYDYKSTRIEYKLSSKDIKALESFLN